MTIWDAIILGIIQGLTEFLPISSSGHLVLGEHVLGLSMPGVSLEIWLHFGTLAAVLIYFFRRIGELAMALLGRGDPAAVRIGRRLLLALVIGTMPAVVVGFTLKSRIEDAFGSPAFASLMLIVTAVILLTSMLAKNKSREVEHRRGLAIGCAQALAILPGISRSGSTITAALLLGVEPALAAEFSFLLAVPAIGGAFALDVMSNGMAAFGGDYIGQYLVGTVVAFVFGLLSIHYLLKIIRKGKFFIFGFYCLVVGVISYIFVT